MAFTITKPYNPPHPLRSACNCGGVTLSHYRQLFKSFFSHLRVKQHLEAEFKHASQRFGHVPTKHTRV